MKWAAILAACGALAGPGSALAEDTTSEVRQAIVAETGSLGTTPTPGLTIRGDEIALGAIEIGLPTSGDGERVGGFTVFDSSANGAQVAVQPTGNGVRALVNVDSAEAPERFAFSIGGEVARLVQKPGGSVVAYDQAGGEVGRFAPAWARDARGVPVSTHYEVTGTELTQVIEHVGADVEYGVTADPFWIPAAVIIARCYTHPARRRIAWNKGVQAGIRWALQHLL